MRCFSLFFILFFVFSFVHAGDKMSEEDIWRLFVKDPSQKHYNACATQLKKEIVYFKDHQHTMQKNNKGEYFSSYTQKHLLGDSVLFYKFLDMVREGNDYAISLAFSVYYLTDGAYIIELSSALSSSINKNPKSFLLRSQQHRKHFKKSDIFSRLIYPGTEGKFVDNPGNIVKELGERIVSLKKVTNKNLAHEKEMFISNLSHAKKSMAQYAESYYKESKKRKLFWKEFCSALIVSPQKTVKYLVKNSDKFGRYYQANIMTQCHWKNDADTIIQLASQISYLRKLDKAISKHQKKFLIDLEGIYYSLYYNNMVYGHRRYQHFLESFFKDSKKFVKLMGAYKDFLHMAAFNIAKIAVCNQQQEKADDILQKMNRYVLNHKDKYRVKLFVRLFSRYTKRFRKRDKSCSSFTMPYFNK